MAIESIDLRQADLVIDATGEEAVGHALTASIGRKKRFIPTLTVWVEGPASR